MTLVDLRAAELLFLLRIEADFGCVISKIPYAK